MFKNYVIDRELNTAINLFMAKFLFCVYMIWKVLSDQWIRFSRYPFMEHRPAIDNVVIYYPDILIVNLQFIQYMVIVLLLVLLSGYKTKIVAFVTSFLLCNLGIVRATADVSFSTQVYFISSMFLMLIALYPTNYDISVTQIMSNNMGKGHSLANKNINEYNTTPMSIFLILLSLLYFGSGIGKLARGGTEWVAGYNLGRSIHHTQQIGYSPTLTSIVLEYNSVLYMSAIATLVIEIGFLIVLLTSKKYLFSIFLYTLIIFHIGIALIMGPVFIYNIVFILMFLDWENLNV